MMPGAPWIMRFSLSMAVVLAACGGARAIASGDDGGSVGAGSEGGSGTQGGGFGGNEICSDAGARRDADPSESAQYCICTPMGEESVWDCYGPSPSAPKPNATCKRTTVDEGTGDGSCLVQWESCSDGQLYAVSCIDGACYCMVQGEITVYLPALQSCAQDKPSINSLCGWDLQ